MHAGVLGFSVLQLLATGGVSLGVGSRANVHQPAAPSPSVEDRHFIANTYGFLRSSSDNVGNAAQGILGVQTNLASLSQELEKEYGAWIQKKTSLVGENDGLRSEIAHLQGLLQEQNSLHQEAQRLQDEIALEKKATAELSAKIQLAQQGWTQEKDGYFAAVSKLEQQVENTRLDQSNKAKAAHEEYNSIKDQNRGLQQQIFQLNSELLEMQNAASKRRVEAGQRRAELIAGNEVQQTSLHGLQAQVVAQAQLQQEIRSYQHKVGVQIDERVNQLKMTTDLQASCKVQISQIEDSIKVAQSGIEQAKKAIMDCQTIDAQNQQAQGILNQCLARQKR